MEIVYSKNLLTNGEGRDLGGWEGSAVLEQETFKIKGTDSIRQKVPVKITSEVLQVSAEYLPMTDADRLKDIGDVSLIIHYGNTTATTTVWPNLIE